MFGLAVAALIIGYNAVYVGWSNLKNGGNGPGFFESLGVTKTLSSPADNVAQGSGNQIGQVPLTPGNGENSQTPNMTGPLTV